MEPLGVVADDLTGAMDTGAQFGKGGLHTVVVLDLGQAPVAQVRVINTDSRDASAVEAYRRARLAARSLLGWNVYKKIDSTLRGNVGREIDGLLDGLGWGRALVAPAFPAAGRTVVDGCLLVDGVPLGESSFRRDPLWPACESHVPTLLARQTRRRVGHLPLAVVDAGAAAVAETLRKDSAPILVADASEQEHLCTLARALGQLKEAWLPCGSAGLAEEWARRLGVAPRGAATLGWPADPRPVLVVAGSRHPMTAKQLQTAAGAGLIRLVELSPDGGWDQASRSAACAALDRARNVALTTTFSAYREGKERDAADVLACATTWLAERSSLSGLVLTGGDVARAVCRALGCTALHVVGEVQAGVPVGILVNGSLESLRVVTKAGGFGDERAVMESIAKIQGRKM